MGELATLFSLSLILLARLEVGLKSQEASVPRSQPQGTQGRAKKGEERVQWANGGEPAQKSGS